MYIQSTPSPISQFAEGHSSKIPWQFYDLSIIHFRSENLASNKKTLKKKMPLTLQRWFFLEAMQKNTKSDEII